MIKAVHNRVKDHQCNFCEKRFTKRSHLVNYVWVHTGKKPSKCKKCVTAFTNSSSLRKHMSCRHKWLRDQTIQNILNFLVGNGFCILLHYKYSPCWKLFLISILKCFLILLRNNDPIYLVQNSPNISERKRKTKSENNRTSQFISKIKYFYHYWNYMSGGRGRSQHQNAMEA